MNKINAFLICIGLPCLFFFGGNYMYVNYPDITIIGFFIFLGFTAIVFFLALWEMMIGVAIITLTLPSFIDELLTPKEKK